jgi:hypothetical protein
LLKSGGLRRAVSTGVFGESIDIEDEVVLEICVDAEKLSKNVVMGLIRDIQGGLAASNK